MESAHNEPNFSKGFDEESRRGLTPASITLFPSQADTLVFVSGCPCFHRGTECKLHQEAAVCRKTLDSRSSAVPSPRSLGMYCCVTKYYTLQRLNTTRVYYLTVPVGQESGCSLTESSAQGLTRPQSQAQPGLRSHQRLGWRRITSRLTWVVGRIQFLAVTGLRASVSCWY